MGNGRIAARPLWTPLEARPFMGEGGTEGNNERKVDDKVEGAVRMNQPMHNMGRAEYTH